MRLYYYEFNQRKIFIHPLKYEDWETTITWRNDLDFSALLMSNPFPVTQELEKAWIEGILKNKDNRSVYFGICENESDKLIGIIKLFNINWISRTCYFGIFLGSKKSRGKGIGKVATELITNYAFEKLNLKKISLEVISSNEKAIALYNELGFVQEGKLTQYWYDGVQYLDVYIMSIFRKDLKTRPK